MDFGDENQVSIFFEIHKDLPRQGPGSFESTRRALEFVKPAPSKVLDLGCGPGKQTLDLARLLPEAKLHGVDLITAFVNDARHRAVVAGLDNRVNFEVANMLEVSVDAPVDLVWCEGAAYNVGVEAAITTWRELLKPNGFLALTDAVYLVDQPCEDVTRFWQAYPDMQTVARRREQIVDCGYASIADFVLPGSDWWDDYYHPLEANLEKVRARYGDDPVAQSPISYTQSEIELYRRYPGEYGYAFFILQRA